MIFQFVYTHEEIANARKLLNLMLVTAPYHDKDALRQVDRAWDTLIKNLQDESKPEETNNG